MEAIASCHNERVRGVQCGWFRDKKCRIHMSVSAKCCNISADLQRNRIKSIERASIQFLCVVPMLSRNSIRLAIYCESHLKFLSELAIAFGIEMPTKNALVPRKQQSLALGQWTVLASDKQLCSLAWS